MASLARRGVRIQVRIMAESGLLQQIYDLFPTWKSAAGRAWEVRISRTRRAEGEGGICDSNLGWLVRTTLVEDDPASYQ